MPKWVTRACALRPRDVAYCSWARNHGAVVSSALRLDEHGFWVASKPVPGPNVSLFRVPSHICIGSSTGIHYDVDDATPEPEAGATPNQILLRRWSDIAKAVAYYAKTEGPSQFTFAQRLLEWFQEDRLHGVELGADGLDDHEVDDLSSFVGACINAAVAPSSSFDTAASKRVAGIIDSAVKELRVSLPSGLVSTSRVAMAGALCTAIEHPLYPFEIIPLVERCRPQLHSGDSPSATLGITEQKDGEMMYEVRSTKAIALNEPITLAFHNPQNDPQINHAWLDLSLDEQLAIRFRTVGQ